nr:sensor domain-containing protein [Mycobacterium tilburgii]
MLTAAATMIGGCSSAVAGRPTPADRSEGPTREPVAVSALEGLLLGFAEIDSAVGATSMKVWVTNKGMWNWSSGVSDKNCLAIDGPAQEKVYSGTGWTAVRGRWLDDSVENRRFSDVVPGQPDTVWTVAGVADDNGMLSASEVQEGGDGWSCQRALTVRNNVAVDVVTCAYSQAGTPATDIAGRIAEEGGAAVSNAQLLPDPRPAGR